MEKLNFEISANYHLFLCCSVLARDRAQLSRRQTAYLLHGAGYFHQAHRFDCTPRARTVYRWPPGLALLENGRKRTVRVWAERSPFDLKNVLKGRGYRWSDGSDGRPRSWYVDVCETALAHEIAFLQAEIYLRGRTAHAGR